MLKVLWFHKTAKPQDFPPSKVIMHTVSLTKDWTYVATYIPTLISAESKSQLKASQAHLKFTQEKLCNSLV